MGAGQIFHSKLYKNFMAKLYGIGAAVVILGALFKINHYAGADIMLIAGMGTEAIIFIFSAFEPPHVEPDWSLVYPELRYMYHGGEEIKSNTQSRRGSAPVNSATQQLDKMFEDANMDAAMFEKLGKGLSKLSENAAQMADISSAASATNDYVKIMHKATESAGELSTNYSKTAETLGRVNEKAGQITEVINTASVAKEYIKVMSEATQSVSDLTKTYTKATESFGKTISSLEGFSVDGQQLKEVVKKITSLNTAYELQLQGSTQAAEMNKKLNITLKEYVDKMNQSAENAAQFNKQISELSSRMNALNTVYGNMLSAMNFKS